MDEWARKYLIIAGAAPLKAAPEAKKEEPPKKPEPVVEAVPEAPAPVVHAEEPLKKAPRKRTVKKELNDAAEKPKAKKPAVKRKVASHKSI